MANRYGALTVPMVWGRLDDEAQGFKLLMPCGWSQSVPIVFNELVIWFHTTPSVQHSFTFYKNGTSIGAVTVTTSGNFWRTRANVSLKGQEDNWAVRHDSNNSAILVQDSDESASHVDEGGLIMAALVCS